MEPGRYSGIGNAQYHAMEGLSRSQLDLFSRTPRHYKEVLVEETDAMRKGTAFHSLLLEPDLFGQTIAVAPDVAKRSNADKDLHKKFEADNVDKTIITSKQYADVVGMVESARRNRFIKAILEHPGKAEVSFWWNDPDTGILCKCRPDYLTDDLIIVDAKSTQSADKDDFVREIGNRRYFLQVGFYALGVEAIMKRKIDGFIFVVVESNPPYLTATYHMGSASIETSKKYAKRLLKQFKVCLDKNVWPGYPEEAITIEIPEWIRRKIEDE